MGGVPVLLMMAAVGITFGWQPDDKGGVEYIIQIPPDQVHELEHVGEISSVIDPAVAGHVSRVIIRVGNSIPPKITPGNLTRTSNRRRRADSAISVADRSPIPIPEMDDTRQAIPIPSLDSTVATSLELGQAAVLKPDANDPAGGSGFSFPSVPPSLRNTATQTAQGIRANVDRAGRDLGAQASGQLGAMTQDASAALRKSVEDARQGILVAPPSTRTPNSPSIRRQTPQFTGSDPTGEMARVRSGGPSTEPTNPRDNSWRDFTGPQRAGASTEPVGPSGLDPNNPFKNRRVDAQAESAGSLSNRPGANGLAPRDTFGKMPGGLSLPGVAANPTTGYADRNGYAGSNSATLPGTRGQSGVRSQYEQTQLDRQSPHAAGNQAGQQRDDRLANGERASDRGYPQVRSGAHDAGGYGSLPSRDQQGPQPNVNPDSRLTAAQIAAGAWTVDVYGRAIDRQGRLVEAIYPPSATAGTYEQPRAPLGQPRAPLGQPRAPLGQPRAPLGQPRASVGQPPAPIGHYADPASRSPGGLDANGPARAPTSMANVPNAVGQPSYGHSQTWPATVGSGAETNYAGQTDPSSRSDTFLRSDAVRRDAAIERRPDPPSLSTRPAAAAAGAVNSPRQRVAAQPLFNGLLLISFVANVYLIFWLKNLRIQFRDLVAAKRMANPNNVQ